MPTARADAEPVPSGFRFFPHHLDPAAQRSLLGEVLDLLREAPPFRPTMPVSDRPFSVEMSNAGPLGWVSDRAGYRYQPLHPVTGRPWPPIPLSLLAIWRDLADYPADPEACLVNIYRSGAKMGLHQDRDEQDFAAPVLSLSLGDTAVFRLGGARRRDPARSIVAESGAVMVLGGGARLAFHGIARVLSGSSALVPGGGRINLTLRRVTPPR